MSPVAPGLLTAREAAAFLAISERFLWTLVQAGDPPCVRIGRSVRFDRADLLAWIETRKVRKVREDRAHGISQ